MKTTLTALTGSLCILLLLAGGCSSDEPQARRPISPFYAAKAVTNQALEQGVEYPYTAHLASMHNEPALRVLMRLRGLDELAAEQHGAVLVNLVEIWGDKEFTTVLLKEDDPAQQYVTTLIRDEVWRQYLATSQPVQQAAMTPPAEALAETEPAETEATTETADAGQKDNIEVVCTVDIGGRYGEADLCSLRKDDTQVATEDAAPPATDAQQYIVDSEASEDAPETVACFCSKEEKHRCPNGWCATQHRFPCLHKLAMIRYGQYTAAAVDGIAKE